ncbi:MAG: LPP20 family lipoprotein, partial [Bacteroidetes bacterium]|nr:LPP20 family lipoprotein [Bacteroidota bacterium]
MKTIRSVALLLILVSAAVAQEYPRWFLEQGSIPCGMKAVAVMRAPSLYRDSAVALAFRTGCELLAKYTTVTIKGGQAFWTTEAGVHSMGASYTETYDSTMGEQLQSSLRILDAFVDKQKTIVLLGDSSACRVEEGMKESVRISSVPQPEWVEKLPSHKQYHYGVGTSEDYYYESSSWQRAEQNALMALARATRSTVASLQKKNAVESQDLFNEDLDVQLRRVEVIARWRDVKKRVF